VIQQLVKRDTEQTVTCFLVKLVSLRVTLAMSATAVQTGERKYHGDETNIFREHEKKYRLVIPAGVRPARAIKMAKTDYSDVIDFANMDHNTESNRKLISELTIQKPRESKHFAPLSKAYTLESAPGSSQRKLGV
jgi:hypothetical protein